MYLIIIKYQNGDNGRENDFGRIYLSYLRKKGISIESYLYEFLARSRNAGVPTKITFSGTGNRLGAWDMIILSNIAHPVIDFRKIAVG